MHNHTALWPTSLLCTPPGVPLTCRVFCFCCVQWYVDVVLALLERAGDFCSEDIWHRVVQLITNNEGSQAYAAAQVVEVLKRGASHESLMCMAGYVLGEYGRLIKVGSWWLGVWVLR